MCCLTPCLKRKKRSSLNYSQRELLGDFNQKSDITIIVFGKDEFSSARSKRGRGGRDWPWQQPSSMHICELSP